MTPGPSLKTSVYTTQQIQKLKLAQTPPLGSCQREHNVHAGLTKILSLVVKVGRGFFFLVPFVVLAASFPHHKTWQTLQGVK